MNTPIDNAQKFQRLLQATKEVFGHEATVTTSEDPEYPEDVYTVFELEIDAPIPELIALEVEWAKKVNLIAPGDASFRLLLTPTL